MLSSLLVKYFLLLNKFLLFLLRNRQSSQRILYNFVEGKIYLTLIRKNVKYHTNQMSYARTSPFLYSIPGEITSGQNR